MIKEAYLELKKEFPESIVMIKSGIFMLTFDSDAIIVSKILNYQVINNKLGFPIKSLPNNIKLLNENKLSVITNIDKIIKEYSVNDNDYSKYLSKAKSDNIIKDMTNNIEYLIIKKLSQNLENYNKIIEFVENL